MFGTVNAVNSSRLLWGKIESSRLSLKERQGGAEGKADWLASLCELCSPDRGEGEVEHWM